MSEIQIANQTTLQVPEIELDSFRIFIYSKSGEKHVARIEMLTIIKDSLEIVADQMNSLIPLDAITKITCNYTQYKPYKKIEQAKLYSQ